MEITIVFTDVENNTISVNNEFSVYPNPAKQSLVVSIKSTVNTNTEEKITITNTLGQIVFSNHYKLTNYSINISQLNNGFYYIRIGEVVKKFVVNK